MKKIDARLENLESKIQKQGNGKGYCKCPMQIIRNDPITFEEWKKQEAKKEKPKRSSIEICHRCGKRRGKNSMPPDIVLQPVKANPEITE